MAATGTPTPNIGLRIPQGADPASVDDINYNSNLLDTKLGAVGNTSVQDQIDSLNSNLANKLNYSNNPTSADTQRVITVPNNYRGLLLAIKNTGGGGIWFVSSNSSGTVYVTDAITTTGVVITTSTQTINVTPAVTTNISIIDVYGVSSIG